MNKKGFTLIELLAVIVILAVVMLIGVTAVLPLINKAQKNSLASEGLALVDTGKVAYQAEQLAGSELNLSPNASYCFSLDWLRKHNYYDKASEKYSGSVLIMANKSGKFDYYFWITNGNYHISGGTPDTYTVEDGPGDENIFNCGGLDLNNNTPEEKIEYVYRVNSDRVVVNTALDSIGNYYTNLNEVLAVTHAYIKHHVTNDIIDSVNLCINKDNKELCIDLAGDALNNDYSAFNEDLMNRITTMYDLSEYDAVHLSDTCWSSYGCGFGDEGYYYAIGNADYGYFRVDYKTATSLGGDDYSIKSTVCYATGANPYFGGSDAAYISYCNMEEYLETRK